jgi:hypothetical protein
LGEKIREDGTKGKKSPSKIQVENLKKRETILGILESDMRVLKLTLEKYGC